MSFATYEDVRIKVTQELDLEDEDFVQPSELLKYCHEAIHVAESIILKLCEDYFLDKTYISLKSGQANYSLPADIYADKVRKLIYYNPGSRDLYNITRLRRQNDLRDMHDLDSGDTYRYLITNDVNQGRKLVLYPTPNETLTNALELWYIRNAALPTGDSDEIDIPEFATFIEKYMVIKCMLKEGHPNIGVAKAELEEEKNLMISTLQNRFPDNDDSLEMDFTFYKEST